MIRALWYFAIVAALAVVAWLIATLPGNIVVSLGGAEVGLSVATALGIIVLGVGSVLGIIWLIHFLVRGPANVSNFWATRRSIRGYEAFSRGMLAIAAGDAAGARRYAERAHNLLDQPAMTLLLTAQAAQLSGDRVASARAFQAMLEGPDTRALALKGLYDQALAAGDYEAALKHATEALRQAPDTPWAFEGRFHLEARLGCYEDALDTLDRGLGQGLVPRPAARRRRAVLLAAIAQAEATRLPVPGEPRDEEDIEPGAPDAQEIRASALRHAVEARDLAPDLVPAAALAARLVAEDGRARRAQRIIEDTWAQAPHPALADVFLDLFPQETPATTLKRVRALSARNPDHVETKVLIARAAIAARDWQTARDALAPYASPFPTRRICLLMAEIEDGAGSEIGRTREWLSRAMSAPPSAQWVADGYRSPHWIPVVPTTGAFDALEWRTPVEGVVPSASSTEEAMAAAAQTVVLPPAPVVETPPAETPKPPAPRPAAPPVETKAPQAPAPTSAPAPAPRKKPSGPVPQAPSEARPGAFSVEAQEGEVDVYIPPPPDDPGPVGEDEDADRPAW